jgi:hypothetical protein
MKRTKTGNNIEKKRNKKNSARSRRSSRKSRSVKSSPYKIEKITEIENSAFEETPIQPIQEILSEISESEKDKIEHEVLLSKSELSRESEVSIPVISDGPLTRSRTKEYIVRRHTGRAERPKRIKLGFERVPLDTSPIVESPRPFHRIYSPLRDRVVTPMKTFARNIQHRVKTTHFINSELFTNAFVLGIVFLCIMVWLLNLVSKTPLVNYDLPKTGTIPHLDYKGEGHYVCMQNATKIHRL